MIDQFDAWRTALATNKPVAYEKGRPTAGYYRVRGRNPDRSIRWDAVAIWETDRMWHCWRTGFPAPVRIEDIEELFVNCNSTPISYELFQTVSTGGPWPEDVEKIEPRTDLPQHEAVAAELEAQSLAAKAWFKSLGHPVSMQAEADRAANYASEFGRIEKKVIGLHEVEKRPILEAARDVDARWFSIRDAARTARAWAKGLSDDYAHAETARRQKEAAEETARLRKSGDDTVVAAEPVRVGTTGRRQSLRRVRVYEISDASALLHFLADRNVKSQALLDAALADARKLHEIGTEVPGLKAGTVEKMT